MVSKISYEDADSDRSERPGRGIYMSDNDTSTHIYRKRKLLVGDQTSCPGGSLPFEQVVLKDIRPANDSRGLYQIDDLYDYPAVMVYHVSFIFPRFNVRCVT